MPLNIHDLLTADSYSHPASDIRLCETHVSWVILTGEFAYKIKKAVHLPFLDFSTLENRQYYCDQELKLNQRYSPGLYLAVVGMYDSGAQLYVGDRRNSNDTLLDYAVKMRQFSPEHRLDKLLDNGLLSARDIDQLGVRIARYHMQAKAFPDVKHGGQADEHSGEPDHVIVPAMDNFKEIATNPVHADTLKLEHRIESWTAQQSRRLRKTMLQRKADGQVRDCHGDLHLENLYLNGDQIDAFDCIEFNTDWRHIDVISEVAFLFVDLLSRNHHEFAYRFINSYLEYTGHYDGVRLLRFYSVYRAMVRAKVIAFRLQQLPDGSERRGLIEQYRHFIHLANGFCEPSDGALLVMCGLSASGKSTVAGQLMQQLPGIRIRSDVERKRLHFYLPDENCSANIMGGIYSSSSSEEVYSRLHYLTKLICQEGYTTVVDAACLRRSQRDRFRRLARSIGKPLLFVYCTASFEELERRIVARCKSNEDPSDADVDILCFQTNSAELPDDAERADTITINTEQSDAIAKSTDKVRTALYFTAGN